jgi:hypothetical protein
VPGDFDIAALYAALDALRRARHLSWQQAAREIGGSISPPTVRGMRGRRVVEGDGVLQMLRWLGRTPESFVPGHDGPNTPLPEVPPGRILRFDTVAIYSALDAQRGARGLAWSEVAREIGGCGAASLTRLSKGGRTGFPDVMRVARWLGRPVAAFTRIAER